MKRLLPLVLALFSIITVSARSNPLTVKSGSLDQLLNPENTVWFTVNYDKAKVLDVNGKSYTLKGYLKHRGPDFVADWKGDEAYAFKYMPVRFNQVNRKGAQALLEKGPYDIKGSVVLDMIDFGNVGGNFIPFSGGGIGGCVLRGTLTFTNKKGAKICVIPFAVQGSNNYSETIRLGLAYFELMNRLGDNLKELRKEKEKAEKERKRAEKERIKAEKKLQKEREKELKKKK